MNWQAIRDGVLFVVGIGTFLSLLGVWIVTGRVPDPSLLLAAGGMAGLPPFLRKDENGAK